MSDTGIYRQQNFGHRIGFETEIDLEALAECGRLAEDVVGHPLPGSVMKGGSLRRLREKLSAAARA